ncbi:MULTISPECIES: helix-turn-helix transcriptional regulator [Bartonella]|uniref:Phage transcriptional regulator n=1 Tax=Bartonella schoenbuchensis m07a TaxID=1094496 RepID=N6UHA6_9HYPH|nr:MULTISPECIES: helix-turn-helix domain-containing protein [Bartonella]ENN91894.1 putative phage transcriptional regulator [Bartonella schoenbuchensis m07a]
MMFDDGDRYVTTHECAQLFSVSTTTIRNWVTRGLFPKPYKLGKSVRWRKKEILAFIPKEISCK